MSHSVRAADFREISSFAVGDTVVPSRLPRGFYTITKKEEGGCVEVRAVGTTQLVMYPAHTLVRYTVAADLRLGDVVTPVPGLATGLFTSEGTIQKSSGDQVLVSRFGGNAVPLVNNHPVRVVKRVSTVDAADFGAPLKIPGVRFPTLADVPNAPGGTLLGDKSGKMKFLLLAERDPDGRREVVDLGDGVVWAVRLPKEYIVLHPEKLPVDKGPKKFPQSVWVTDGEYVYLTGVLDDAVGEGVTTAYRLHERGLSDTVYVTTGKFIQIPFGDLKSCG